MFILPAVHFLLFATISWASATTRRPRHPIDASPSLSERHGTPGLNCHGGVGCLNHGIGLKRDPKALACYIYSYDDNAWFEDGDLLASTNYIGAFLKNTGGKYARDIKPLARALADLGCDECGHAAFDHVDVNNGELYFGYVDHDCIGHLCHCRGEACCNS